MTWFALLGALPLILFLMMTVWKKPEYVGALWTHPLGIRMSLYAGLSLALYYVLILALCMGLNRAAPGTTGLWTGLTGLLGGILFVLLVLPGVFVILVGPAAIAVMENLETTPAP